MAEIINQCCYTHIGSWKTTAQKGSFEQKYISELSRHATLPGPEYGSNFTAFETVGDGDRFLIMRTQYGLRDLSTASGRASMFSHGYLIDTSGEKFDPNVFLTIAKDNFCTNEDEASKDRDHFQRVENFTLKTAMVAAGLTKDSFSKLIKCVYQLAVRSVNKQALFIRAKDETQSLALLYCIYSALMPRYSKFISSSSVEYNFSDMRNIVFTKTVNTSRKYFIPEIGENNVLSVNVEKNIDSLYFVDYGVKNFSTTEAIQDYFVEFEKTLKIIANSRQIDDNVIRLAHVMTADPTPSKASDIVSDDEALMSILKFAEEFNKETPNEDVKQYIDKLREEAIKRGLIKVDPPKVDSLGDVSVDETSFDDIGNNASSSVNTPSYSAYGTHGGDISFNRSGSTTRPPDVYIDKTRRAGTSEVSTGYNTYRQKYSNGANSPYGNSTTMPGSRYATYFFTDSEKKRFENNLKRFANRGVSGFVYFDRAVELVFQNIGDDLDETLRQDLANSIFNNFCNLVIVSVQNTQTPFKENPFVYFEKWFKRLGYTDIHKIKKNILAEYWTKFQWKNFTVVKAVEYQFFAIEKEEQAYLLTKDDEWVRKAETVYEISNLVTQTLSFKAEDWICKLNDICLHSGLTSADREGLKKTISGFYLKNVTAKRKVSDLYSDKSCINSIITFAMYFQKVEFDKLMKTWQIVYLYLITAEKKKDSKDVVEAIEEIASMQYSPKGNINFVFSSTKDYFMELESRGILVPFDFWLALGMANIDEETNEAYPFGMFYAYDYEPKTKAISPSEIVSTSILLKKEEYLKILLDVESKETKDKFIKNLVKAVSGDESSGIGGKLKSIFGRKKNNDS